MLPIDLTGFNAGSVHVQACEPVRSFAQ
jgi:hypothetical protein